MPEFSFIRETIKKSRILVTTNNRIANVQISKKRDGLLCKKIEYGFMRGIGTKKYCKNNESAYKKTNDDFESEDRLY